jgi:hypothetical protein
MSEETKEDLLRRIDLRRVFDRKWATINQFTSHFFAATAIIASLVGAILAAADKTNPIVLACLTALPGAVIIVDRTFLFSARWRWHETVAKRMEAMEHVLRFQSGSVKDISIAMTTFLAEMENKYPAGKGAGLPIKATRE